ncbi:methyltransferase domain-containing protein [Dysgonomonas sp. 521]|uniref:tRNA1(Val) (adenine(37)-N6)-methyltransferase n=1 Tax=Dysgonomonas sp. 521 TaxID=2302932 RepID=UPI0013D11A18|nr:methyltransferase [Dysgonomonas sp. 521]NDV94471.1 methyltransferase domain-containing protein [Dysgonomonas sp. 521]
MPNSYFRFKQFTVYHDRCAMKVGTDGVLLGAWADVAGAGTVLDIGTGTGLIALMIAQRNNDAAIDAIDIDMDAVVQAKENIANSPFSSRITCFNTPLQDFQGQAGRKYDLIVSNPPFFIQSLKSPVRGRTLARHTDSLPMEDLIQIASSLLSEKGKLSLIYPHEYSGELQLLAQQAGLFTSCIVNVYPTDNSSPKRVLMEFSKAVSDFSESSLVIEKTRHVYSDDYTALTKDFYLKL